MKSLTHLVILLAFCADVFGTESIWTAFWDEGHDLKGFRDEQGVVQIKPKFMGFSTTTKFRHIMAVTENINDAFVSYYLLKDGRRIGVGDSYVSDMTFDCESEYKIRFREKESGKVGYFDGAGNVVIPPEYDDGTAFKNGLASVIKNARKACPDGTELTAENMCEHWYWKDGERFVIDQHNAIVLEGVNLSPELDLYSMRVSENESTSETTQSFKGSNGKFYIFTNFEKQFEHWFNAELLPGLDEEKLLINSFDRIMLWDKSKGWYEQDKQIYLNKSATLIVTLLKNTQRPESQSFVVMDGLIRGIYDTERYDQYFDDCENPLTGRYPVLQLITEHRSDENYLQNAYDFLKTEDGFKLISLAIRARPD